MIIFQKNKCYDSLDIASYVIEYCDNHDYIISNLKLQKLLYFIQVAFLLNKNGVPCFKDKIEAWGFGPVIPRVYRQYAEYGAGNIPRVKPYFFEENETWNIKKNTFNIKDILKSDREIINQVVEKFKNYSSTMLTDLSLKQAPWIDNYSEYKINEITIVSLIDFFKPIKNLPKK